MKYSADIIKIRQRRFAKRVNTLLKLKKRLTKACRPKKTGRLSKKGQTGSQHPDQPHVKKIHLKLEDAIAKKAKLQQQVKTEEVLNNKTKRKRIFQELAHLNRAIQNPTLYLVDPEEQKRQREEDQKRRIEKKLAKAAEKKKLHKKQIRHKKRCLKCNSRDHIMSECPQAQSGYCFKCGSYEHTHTQCTKDKFDFAECFVCKEKGHIARECPKNEKGLYVKGGSCFGCGSVRHTLKDCPVRHGKKMAATNQTF